MKEAIKYKFDPVLYMHPADRAMLTKLEKVKVIIDWLGYLNDRVCRQMEIDLMGSGIHVTEKSMPELYKNYRNVCEFFGVENPPCLYLSGDPQVNAFAMGSDRAFIVVHEALLWRLNDKEQKFLFGHELAHIMAGHMKYQSLIYAIYAFLSSKINILANVSVFSMLRLWSRRAEYTCDRAGMLVAQDLGTVCSFFLKLSGLPQNYFNKINPRFILEQAEEFQQVLSGSLADTVTAATNQAFATHPRPIERAAEIKEWVDEGWYEEIINGSAADRAKLAELLRKDSCHAEMSMMFLRSVIAWAVKRLNVPREKAALPIRKALYEQKTLQGSPVERILGIEVCISPAGNDRVEYILKILYNDGGSARADSVKIPLPDSMDFVPDEIRERFIRNGYKPVIDQLYKMQGC